MIKCALIVFLLSLNVFAADDITAAATATMADASVTTEAEMVPSPVVNQKAIEKNEAKIPLNLEKAATKENTDGSIFKLLFGFSVLAIFIVGAFYFLKKYAQPKNNRAQNQIKIISQHYLGPKKSLALVRVAGETVLVGITDNNINLIKTMSLLDEEIPEVVPGSFEKVLKKSTTEFSTKSEMMDESEEDFSIRGIKDIVSSKLKNMRTLN